MNRRAGFSVLDISTALVIAAAVLAIVIPGMARSRADANLAKCESNLHAIGNALASYASHNGDLMPQTRSFTLPGWTAGPKKVQQQLTWCEALVIDGSL